MEIPWAFVGELPIPNTLYAEAESVDKRTKEIMPRSLSIYKDKHPIDDAIPQSLGNHLQEICEILSHEYVTRTRSAQQLDKSSDKLLQKSQLESPDPNQTQSSTRWTNDGFFHKYYPKHPSDLTYPSQTQISTQSIVGSSSYQMPTSSSPSNSYPSPPASRPEQTYTISKPFSHLGYPHSPEHPNDRRLFRKMIFKKPKKN
jgi:hypothetical protein